MKKTYQQPVCQCTVILSQLPLVASGEDYTVNGFTSAGEEELGGDAPRAVKANPVDWNK